jgi:hypothetical protein
MLLLAGLAALHIGLDVTDLGRDIIRIDGTAAHVPGFSAADQVPEYVVKYAERIEANFEIPGWLTDKVASDKMAGVEAACQHIARLRDSDPSSREPYLAGVLVEQVFTVGRSAICDQELDQG